MRKSRPTNSLAIANVCHGLLILLNVGCDKAKQIETLIPVAGRVLVDDQPVTSGTVSFRPDAKRGNHSMQQPASMLGPTGDFELITANHKGAPPGWYRVLVIADNFREADPPRTDDWPKVADDYAPKTLVNSRYLYFNETDLSVEVTPNPSHGQYELRLKP